MAKQAASLTSRPDNILLSETTGLAALLYARTGVIELRSPREPAPGRQVVTIPNLRYEMTVLSKSTNVLVAARFDGSIAIWRPDVAGKLVEIAPSVSRLPPSTSATTALASLRLTKMQRRRFIRSTAEILSIRLKISRIHSSVPASILPAIASSGSARMVGSACGTRETASALPTGAWQRASHVLQLSRRMAQRSFPSGDAGVFEIFTPDLRTLSAFQSQYPSVRDIWIDASGDRFAIIAGLYSNEQVVGRADLWVKGERQWTNYPIGGQLAPDDAPKNRNRNRPSPRRLAATTSSSARAPPWLKRSP
jgi:hypothetical protein